MAVIDFPNTPSPGQQYTAGNGVVYQYTGSFWLALTGAVPPVVLHRAFGVAHSGNVFIPANSSIRVPFDSVIFDDSGGAWRTSTQDFSTPDGGYWEFSLTVTGGIDWTGGGGGQLELWIEQYLVAGGSYKHGTTVWTPASGAATNLAFSKLMKMAVNDAVVVWIRNTATTSGATLYAGNDVSSLLHYGGIRIY
jgi:hypothetical protein